MVRIKICGISRAEEAEYINMYRPDYFGMVIGFKKSRRNIDEQRAAELRNIISGDIPAVGVFVDADEAVVERLLNEGVIDIAQLHGHEDESYIERLQRSTRKPVWKAFEIKSPDDIASAVSSRADIILLDNGYGTGERFDWSLIGKIERRFALAGGLDLNNIDEAIRKFRPYIADVSSGVETDGKKDGEKIRSIIELVRNNYK